MKNKESGFYSVFFQANDTNAMDLAFKRTIEKFEKKENKREFIKEILNKFKKRVKNIAVKDKVKKKYHEHERWKD